MNRIRTRAHAKTPRKYATCGVVASLALALFRPALAAAETPDGRSVAHAHFERGVSLSRQHAYEDALLEFQAAYRTSPHFSVLYNIGQAEVALGYHAQAASTLQRYLDEGGAQIAPARRAEVEATLAQQIAHTGAVEVRVDVAQALVSIDGIACGRSPLPGWIRVEPGKHIVFAVLDSGERRETTFEVSAQEQRRVELTFAAASPAELTPPAPVIPVPTTPAPALPAAPPPAMPTAPPPSTPRSAAPGALAPLPASTDVAPSSAASQRTLAYVLGGVGVALSGAALAHYLWNRGRYQDWKDAYAAYYKNPDEKQREATNQLSDSIARASRVTIGLAVGAGFAFGTGGVLFITSEDSPTERSHGQKLRPYVAWRGRF